MSNLLSVTIPLSDIRRIQIYINTPRKTVAQIKSATGADYVLNGTLYNMTTGAVNCHMKADGKVYGKPPYAVYGYAWNSGPDIFETWLPEPSKSSYISCTPLILKCVPLSKLTYDPGQGGRRGRSAIGLKGDRLALYCSRDGSSYAQTPEALRNDLAEAGWTSAVMLDGGGSSQCDFRGQTITSSRKVQHLILVYLKSGTNACPYSEPIANVRSGSVGTGAKWVQWYLNQNGAKLDVDGVFGAKSVAALKEFQKKSGLAADGICGPATRNKLKGGVILW